MTIPIEKLLAVKHLVLHTSCPDGIASGMILHQVLPDATIQFIQYDDLDHINIEPRPGTLFCDFSPFYPKQPKEATEEDYAEYEKVKAEAERKIVGWIEHGCIVLDHHKTQKAVVERFGDLGVFADEEAEPGVCGATLAYREVWQPLMAGTDDATIAAAENLATLAGIRDTWQKQDPKWRKACEQAASLFFWDRDELVKLHQSKWADKLVIGPILFEKTLSAARSCIKNGWRFTSDKGTRVIVISSLTKTSDAAEILDKEVDWVVGFGLSNETDDKGVQHPKCIYSTRSHTDFNCATFASAHGGGGHTAAAGFKVKGFDADKTLNPYGLIRELLNKYEAE